nr:MAG TPA: hypothetical protein [Caudoviricetes sp.]
MADSLSFHPIKNLTDILRQVFYFDAVLFW